MAKLKSKSNSKGILALKSGDLVDVVAPGFGTTQDKLDAGVEYLKSLGLRTRVPADLFGPDVVCGQQDSIRMKHLKAALLAKDSKAIWCVRAGYGAYRLLPELAKLKAKAKPKLFLGYSDSTTVHHMLVNHWGWVSYHSPLLDRLGQKTLPLNDVEELEDLIMGRGDEIVHGELEPLNKAAQMKKSVSGKMFGGNLVVTASHLATPWAKSAKGQILFFEDIGERGYRVDRILKMLQYAKFLEGVKAVVFGDFVECKEPDGTDKVPGVIERFASEVKVPVFRGLRIGHGVNQRAMPLGVMATLKCGPAGELIVPSGLIHEPHILKM